MHYHTHVKYTRSRHPILGQKGQMTVGEKGKQLGELSPSTFAACDCNQLPSAESISPCSRTLVQLQVCRFQSQPSIARAISKNRVHLNPVSGHNGPVMSLLAATTEDCIATYSCPSDITGVLSSVLQQAQMNARHKNICLHHVHTCVPFLLL